jgi:predicted membrane protein
MNSKIKKFFKINFSLYHVAGVVLGIILSVLYWYKKGQFSNNVLRNNIILTLLWGISIGYITFDFIKSTIDKNKKQ